MFQGCVGNFLHTPTCFHHFGQQQIYRTKNLVGGCFPAFTFSKCSQYHVLFSSISHMDVSENSGTPKSSIWIGFSMINHPFWGTPILGNTHINFIVNATVFITIVNPTISKPTLTKKLRISLKGSQKLPGGDPKIHPVKKQSLKPVDLGSGSNDDS